MILISYTQTVVMFQGKPRIHHSPVSQQLKSHWIIYRIYYGIKNIIGRKEGRQLNFLGRYLDLRQTSKFLRQVSEFLKIVWELKMNQKNLKDEPIFTYDFKQICQRLTLLPAPSGHVRRRAALLALSSELCGQINRFKSRRFTNINS